MAKYNVEVLAPAGSMEALQAAVRSGADAVYLGAREMNARRNAENFDEQQLKEAVSYCHIRGVAVYLTLNILISNNELSRALEIVRSAYRAGIDAVIVQDLGLARLIHSAFPEMPLHASTQMTVMSPAALPALKELGFCRVVAAREMSEKALRELCDAARKLDMTVEVFVHGALCMSVSGQCLMSAVLGGRSGNRGLCAGPCRLPFSAPSGTGFDLSLKDLSLLSEVERMAQMGVVSLKIEGRMKRPEYVAAATAAVRQALDSNEVSQNLLTSLNNVFSRSGFTNGYFTGKIGSDMFGTRTKEDVAAANMAFPFIHEYYRNERQSVPIAIRANINENGSSLTLCDGVNTVTVNGEIPQKAQMRELDNDTVVSYITKLGGTPYYSADVATRISSGLFLRGADLNAMRRDAVEALNKARSKSAKRQECEYKLSREFYYPSQKSALVVRLEDANQMCGDMTGVSAVIFPLEKQPPKEMPQNVRLIADIPRGMPDELVASRLRIFKNHGCKAALCGNLANIKTVKDMSLAPIAGLGLNAYNSESVSVMKSMGCRAVTMSPELYLSDICKMNTALPKGIFAYGRLPLMLTKNCPVANGMSCEECGRNQVLTDRLGTQFPVRCRAGFSEVLNSVPIYLADRLSEIKGIDFMLLYFTDEDKSMVERIINAYRFGAGVANGGYTRGLYYRKVD
ncbi:MAG: U32 family peptidase [Ruminococcaceae bacterium]|nr:U32 family peptidase [Oscillospiraceae bacterium]